MAYAIAIEADSTEDAGNMKHTISEWNAPGIFITGTDTGVGKTWAGARLIPALARRGLRVAPRKPLESGWEFGDDRLTDAGILAAAVPGGTALDVVCRWRLPQPVSPARAAEQAGVNVSLSDVIEACRIETEEFTLVEGAGGFYSPLTRDALNADLAEALDLPVLLVVADRLGCINHTLLSAAAIAKHKLTLCAVLLNRIEAPVDSAMDNAADLRRYLDCPVLCSERLGAPDSSSVWVEDLADLVTRRPAQG
ncbi:MAG: dethiobiotin synthase [Pseudomonadota bacterium]|nr:dethiobiotin synthase [Pseudomonadota bacterium]